jgi:hypothetical protein
LEGIVLEVTIGLGPELGILFMNLSIRMIVNRARQLCIGIHKAQEEGAISPLSPSDFVACSGTALA